MKTTIIILSILLAIFIIASLIQRSLLKMRDKEEKLQEEQAKWYRNKLTEIDGRLYYPPSNIEEVKEENSHFKLVIKLKKTKLINL